MNSFDELRTKAEKGDARAQLDLALAYQKAVGCRQDNARAFEWFRKAADQGLAEAQFNLGLLFQFGIGAEKNCAEAIRWLGAAADQGHFTAANQLGWMYRDGVHLQQDRAEAIRWFLKAADCGDKVAQYNLGTLYAGGQEGTERDDAEAVKWLHKAAKQGHDAAQYALGGHYAEGRGVEKDDKLAVAWFQKAASQGYAAANTNLRRWSRVPGQNGEKDPSNELDPDIGAIIKADPQSLRILEIHQVHTGYLSLRLLARLSRWSKFSGYHEIACFNAVDYSIRPTNPATLEGGPAIEYHEKHPLLMDHHLQLVPGSDGDVFRPSLNLKLLILDQSHVIAERFQLRKPDDLIKQAVARPVAKTPGPQTKIQWTYYPRS